MNHCQHLSVFLLALILLGTAIVGCSERVQRENVFANTETGVGIFIAQDPKTQMYEGKIGYFRHELFYVPTGKLVTYKNDNGELIEDVTGGQIKNDANIVPDVLAEIRVGVAAQGNTPKMDLYQRLAVGPTAVGSDAAKIMMINGEENESNLAALISPSKTTSELRSELDRMIESGKLKGTLAANYPDVDAYANKLAGEISNGKRGWTQIRADGGSELKTLVYRLRPVVDVP